MANLILLKFPTYKEYNFPYKNRKYYTTSSENKVFFEEIKKVYDGYCPYCGEKFTTRSAIKEKEHTIERKQYPNLEAQYIKHCKFNFCLACSTCNKLKAKKLVPIAESYFTNDILETECLKKDCTSQCLVIYNALTEYLNLNKIIIQPYGVIDRVENHLFEISYDVEIREFIPYENTNFSEYNKNFINSHIKKFKLNENKPNGISLEFINDLIYDLKYSEYKIDEGYISRKNYSFKNILQKIFLEYLTKLTPIQQKIKLDLLKKEYQKSEMK